MKRKNVSTYIGSIFLPLLLFLLLLGKGGEAQAAGLNVDSHSQTEVRQMWKSLNIQTGLPASYSKTPSATAPYDCGEVSAETLQNGLKTLNFVRYVAGIPYNVQINDEYQKKAQAAALIGNVQGGLSHDPKNPGDMDPTLFELCHDGASSSNLGMGRDNLYEEIVNGWMNDGDSSNIDRIGHRRWCLNPTMQYTGLGVVGRNYAMYAFDGSFKDNGYSKVAWPAQNMPLELFEVRYPWSISVGTEVDIASTSVTLKRVSDGKTWHFSASGAEGYFNVNNDNYGQKGCIIFLPYGIDEYKEGDNFEVSITGSGLSVSYEVQFFYIHEHTGGTATCLNPARCSICGNYYGELAPHSFGSDWTIIKEASCTEDGLRAHPCTVQGCSETSEAEPYDALGHTGGTATCQMKAICSRCQQPYGELAPHSFGSDWIIDTPATCQNAGSKSHHCQISGCTQKQDVTKIEKLEHSWGSYEVTAEATVFENGMETRSCDLCGEKQSRETAKLNPTIQLSKTSLKLKVKKSEQIAVTGLANGDKVKSWKSNRTKIAKVNGKGKIVAQNKPGSATVTVTLESGLTRKIKVTVQAASIPTKKLSGIPKKLTVRKGKKYTLKPVASPANTTDKITYKTSNSKVASVSAKGVITARKTGKVTITVKSGKKTVKCKVTVKK